METRTINVLDAFIDRDTLRDNNEIGIIKVRAFVGMCLLWILTALVFVISNAFQDYHQAIIPLLSSITIPVLLLFLLRNGVNKDFIYGVFMAFTSALLLVLTYVTSDYVRILPWWGPFVMVYSILAEKVSSTLIWVSILYACALTSLSFGPDNLFHNGIQNITLLFLCSFAVQNYYVKRKNVIIDKLDTAHNEIKILKGLLPICSNCKKIRDDTGSWNRIETYIPQHSEAEFTHSCCPDCVKELYPDLADEILADQSDESPRM